MLSLRKSLVSVVKSCYLSTTINSRFLSTRKYTDKHEWICLNGELGTVGISDYAQEKLGEVVYLELPKIGTKLAKGDVFATLESVKAVSECYSPASGTIAEINTNLSDNASLLNKSPHDDGWLVKLKIDSTNDVDSLMSEDKYQEYLKTHE